MRKHVKMRKIGGIIVNLNQVLFARAVGGGGGVEIAYTGGVTSTTTTRGSTTKRVDQVATTGVDRAADVLATLWSAMDEEQIAILELDGAASEGAMSFVINLTKVLFAYVHGEQVRIVFEDDVFIGVGSLAGLTPAGLVDRIYQKIRDDQDRDQEHDDPGVTSARQP